MSLSTFAGKITSQEFKDIQELIKLYSTGRTLKSKFSLPNTHKVKPEQLKAKNDKWKQYIK